MCDTSAMPDSSIAIRRASPQDAVLLAELGARTFEDAFGPTWQKHSQLSDYRWNWLTHARPS
jgi:hypothetical protein